MSPARQDDEEGPEKRAVIASACGCQGDEFPQGDEGCGGKHEQRSGVAEEHGEGEQRRHDPPRVGPGDEVLHDAASTFAGNAPPQYGSGGAEKRQDHEDPAEEFQQYRIGIHDGDCSAMTELRAFVRKESRDSPGSRETGVPK